MKKALALILCLVMLLGVFPMSAAFAEEKETVSGSALLNEDPSDAPAELQGFTDVPSNSYYKDAVTWAINMNITSGTSPTTFGPGDGVTRGQAITFLWALKGRPNPRTTTNPFTDVKSSKYYYKAVLWGAENGYVAGYVDHTFKPDNVLTREHIITMIYALKGRPQNFSSTFSDVKSTDYFFNAARWCQYAGLFANWAQITNAENKFDLIKGYNGGKLSSSKFEGKAPCTRALAVTFLYRACKAWNKSYYIYSKDMLKKTITTKQGEVYPLVEFMCLAIENNQLSYQLSGGTIAIFDFVYEDTTVHIDQAVLRNFTGTPWYNAYHFDGGTGTTLEARLNSMINSSNRKPIKQTFVHFGDAYTCGIKYVKMAVVEYDVVTRSQIKVDLTHSCVLYASNTALHSSVEKKSDWLCIKPTLGLQSKNPSGAYNLNTFYVSCRGVGSSLKSIKAFLKSIVGIVKEGGTLVATEGLDVSAWGKFLINILKAAYSFKDLGSTSSKDLIVGPARFGDGSTYTWKDEDGNNVTYNTEKIYGINISSPLGLMNPGDHFYLSVTAIKDYVDLKVKVTVDYNDRYC